MSAVLELGVDARRRRLSSRWRFAALLATVVASLAFVACGDDAANGDGGDGTGGTPTITTTPVEPTVTETATATETGTATATATETPAATSTPDETDDGPAAPTNVRLSGRLPDLNETVAPGEGESGRITIEWDFEDGDITGFRVYQRECDGTVVAEPIDVGAEERQLGPLQPCRPGGDVGVSSVSATGESEIVWSQGS